MKRFLLLFMLLCAQMQAQQVSTFALLEPVDETVFTLTRSDAYERFRWLTAALSATYEIHFARADNLQREIVLPSDSGGSAASLTVTHNQLFDYMSIIMETPNTTECDVIWYVVASTPDDTGTSTPIGPGIPGYRLRLTDDDNERVGVAFDFADAHTPVVLTAGDSLCVDLLALRSDTLIEDWDQTGRDVTLFIRDATVDVDTSRHSWSADSRAFTWSRLIVSGTEIPLLHPREYIIPRELFEKGRARLCYQSSKAETDIRMELRPGKAAHLHQSPSLTWNAGALDRLLLECTWPDSTTPAVFLYRPFEILLTPQDRYLNTITDDVRVRMEALHPGEIDTVPGSGVHPLTAPEITLNGRREFYFMANTARPLRGNTGQMLLVTSSDDQKLNSSLPAFAQLAHPPAPFDLVEPSNNAVIRLVYASLKEVFSWTRPDPVDLYDSVRLSIDSDEYFSDSVRYTLTFQKFGDSSTTRVYASDSGGRLPRLTLNHGTLAGIIDEFNGIPTTVFVDVIWWVTATDGTDTVFADSTAPGYIGRRIRFQKTGLDAPVYTPMVTTLSRNYPNPATGTTTIDFSSIRSGLVTLTVHDMLGKEIARLVDAPLAPGAHSAVFNTHALPAGVYVYRLSTPTSTLTRKMLINQ
ncbi:T9SS type A sorting domain-containing protein [bacterium]|nr:T9SS type A sorting domain-containing protein [bacterium]